MDNKPFAAATERNKSAILGVLRDELATRRGVLEIGSGTGQHAVHFSQAMPHVIWQTSDMASNHPGILAWLQDAALPNVLPPLELDVRRAVLPKEQYDAVFTANTAHIMSSDTVESMFTFVAHSLRACGRFLLYGPLRIEGRFTAPSNEQFDESLRAQNPEMGVRDLEELDRMAHAGTLRRKRLYAMPANNYIAVWEKSGG